ncbi:MAG: FHA domain-containing protein, partial [Anaerolineales bacterium]|nr:FHA domain-containing protein [Anaerolineales bacterium]MDW8226824.1 FHA domain-containing protein [Anaerolineales bacterium]
MSAGIVLTLRLLLAASLYAFLLLALLLLWHNIRRQTALLSEPKIPPIALSLITESGKELFRRFDTSEVVIGRHASCEFQLNDDSVSAYHARLNYHHRHWWVEDLGST